MVLSLYVEAEMNSKRTITNYSRIPYTLDSSANHFFGRRAVTDQIVNAIHSPLQGKWQTRYLLILWLVLCHP